MTRAVTTPSLDPVLRGVSRSIFLTLRVAPGSMQRQLGIGYLFCRAADTIADTRLVPRGDRLEILRRFRGLFAGDAFAREEVEAVSRGVSDAQSIPEERELLVRLGEVFEAHSALAEGDRALLRRLVSTLTRGMEMDLERFPDEESGSVRALDSEEELDRYTYYVAGCVGEFWTDLQVRHVRALRGWDLPAMREKGIRFGKGLQLTNILRDVDRDLAIGRCYFPAPRLEAVGVTPEELRAGRSRERIRPVIDAYMRLTLEHYREGWEYTLAVPRRVPRLRLACAWPLLIGLATLRLVAAAPEACAPGAALRIPQRECNRILLGSTVRVFSNAALRRMYGRLERGVKGAGGMG